MDEKILTPDQVAQILQVHPFTVLKFIKQGKLRASKLGRVYRIRHSDVMKFLDEQEAASASKSLKTTPKEAELEPTLKIDQMILPQDPSVKGSSNENFVQSVSKKKEQQSAPKNTRTNEIDHYILE
jgi:excisionase family DNA binding protein